MVARDIAGQRTRHRVEPEVEPGPVVLSIDLHPIYLNRVGDAGLYLSLSRILRVVVHLTVTTGGVFRLRSKS